MSFTEDYRRAERALRDLNEAESKITFEARHRIAAKTLRDQLVEHMRQLREDQSDIDFALEADRTPKNSNGWDRE